MKFIFTIQIHFLRVILFSHIDHMRIKFPVEKFITYERKLAIYHFY